MLLTKLFKDSGAYPAYGEYFIELIKEKHHFLFRTAAQSIASYLLIRQALLKSGCTSSQLQQLLNTTHNQVIFQKEIACTPLMTIIYNTIRYPQRNYADFTALLLRFRADGAQLTEEQVFSMRKHLEELKGIVHVSSVHLDLLNDWINAIQVIENPGGSN